MTKISRTTDMTQGSEMWHIIMFSLPLLAGNLLQQTYNIVDTMVVGRYLGDDALAAVGATGSITYLFYTLCIGLLLLATQNPKNAKMRNNSELA